MTDTPLDLFVDLNSMDETGLPWSFLDEATDPLRIVVWAFHRRWRGIGPRRRASR
jgi:hypothetical protein